MTSQISKACLDHQDDDCEQSFCQCRCHLSKIECSICAFSDNAETIIDTAFGPCHRECLDDAQADIETERKSFIRDLEREINLNK